MYAARQGATDAARALAETGADLNLTDPDGTSALVLAIINAHYDLAAMLIDKGADPNVGDSSGMTALYAAVDMNTLDETPGPARAEVHRQAERRWTWWSGCSTVAPTRTRSWRAPLIERVHNNGDGGARRGRDAPDARGARRATWRCDARAARPRRRRRTCAMKNGATALMFVSGRGGLGRFGVYDAKRATDAEFVEGCEAVSAARRERQRGGRGRADRHAQRRRVSAATRSSSSWPTTAPGST